MATILLVEDNALLAHTMVRFLRGQAELHIAATVSTAEAALAQLPHLSVDLVLVDVALPGMNGIDLVASLRQRYPELKCLMLSGHNEASYVGRALAVGAHGYVVKSDPYAILEAIHAVLEGKIYLSKELHGKQSE